MKNGIIAMALMVLATGLTACGGKKKSDDIITQRVTVVKPAAPVKMQAYSDAHDVQWIGKSYHVSVDRQPSDSLPMVKDESGQQFVDNVITLTVKRSDGSVFFKRQFTKSHFAKHINEDYQKTGILEGIVFDKAEGDWLVFAASVAHPQTDEYIPLVVKLSRMGDITVTQDTQMDTANPQDTVS